MTGTVARRPRNKPRAVARPGAATARWPTFLSGFAAGAVAVLVVDAFDLRLWPDQEGDAPGSSEDAGPASASKMVRYEFYDILPGVEVALPHLDTGDAASKPPETTGQAEATAPPAESTTVAAETADRTVETTAQPAETATGQAEAAAPPAESTTVAAETADRTAETAAQPAETATGQAEAATPPAESTTVAAETADRPVETAAQPAETATGQAVKTATEKSAAAQPSEIIAEPGSVYVLQAGSFRHAGDAESMRARLALIGIEAAVQTVSIDGQATWHRVRVGPYTELRALNRARIRLRENQIEALALKVRSP